MRGLLGKLLGGFLFHVRVQRVGNAKNERLAGVDHGRKPMKLTLAVLKGWAR